jgi:hypothetical protein
MHMARGPAAALAGKILHDDPFTNKHGCCIVFRAPNLEAIGVLNKSDVLTLWDFQLRTGARSARFGVWPGVS